MLVSRAQLVVVITAYALGVSSDMVDAEPPSRPESTSSAHKRYQRALRKDSENRSSNIRRYHTRYY